jgi:hypothetical protein
MTVIYINGKRAEVTDKGADEIMRLRSLLVKRNATIKEMKKR